MRTDAAISTLTIRAITLTLGIATAVMTGGCTKKAGTRADDTGPKVEGDKVILPAGSPQKSSLSVEAVKPSEKTIIRLTGKLTWDEDATVRVFAPVAGRVERILAMPGTQVKEGDTLATLYSPDFAQAQADASRAISGLKLAERTLSRLKELFEHGAAPKKDVESAEDDLAAKRSENERAQARLQQYGAAAGTVDGRFPLKAPLTGTVVEKTINPGQEVRSDQMLANDPRLVSPLFVISDPSKLAVLLDVTELDITGLQPGQKLQIRSRAYPDRIFEGKLAYLGQSLDPLTRTVKARGWVDNSNGLLKAEMYVSIDAAGGGAELPPGEAAIATGDHPPRPRVRTQAIDIPTKAVFFKDNRHFVFVENAPDRYERQCVEIGAEFQGRVRIKNGLSAGQRVVTEGSLLLQAMTEGSKD